MKKKELKRKIQAWADFFKEAIDDFYSHGDDIFPFGTYDECEEVIKEMKDVAGNLKAKEKYPVEVGYLITQTGPSSFLVGRERPLPDNYRFLGFKPELKYRSAGATTQAMEHWDAEKDDAFLKAESEKEEKKRAAKANEDFVNFPNYALDQAILREIGLGQIEARQEWKRELIAEGEDDYDIYDNEEDV